MPIWLPELALAGSSLFVFPSFGDSIREPKWAWLWACAATALPFLWRSRAWPKLPPGAWAFAAFALLQPYFFSPAALVWPFTLGLLALLILSRPVASGRGERLLSAAVWLQAALALSQRFGWDPFFERYPEAEAHLPVGFIGQATLFGAWMAAMAWYWAGRRRWAEFFVCSICVFLTESAFSAFAWAAGLGAWLLWKSRLAGFAYAFTLALGSLSALWWGHSFFWDNGRFLSWRMIVSAWSRQPWLGYGMDSFSREFPYLQGVQGPAWLQAHSEPMELLFGGGLLGWALASWMLSHLWLRRERWWGKEESLPWFLALVALMANSLGNFPFHIAPTALLAAMAYSRLVAKPVAV